MRDVSTPAPPPPSSAPGFFVTGTDTDVGKTLVCTGLLRTFARQGIVAGGQKPVAAGLQEDRGHWVNDDVLALQSASGIDLSAAEVCALPLRTACAPHLAAAIDGVIPDRAALVAHVRRLLPRADAWVVEGAGGFCVPMSPTGSTPHWGLDDLAADLNWPIVIVVGLRLGCLSHALLTARAVRARGLRLAGWVGNRVDPAMALADDNLRSLHDLLDAPCLGVVPHLQRPSGEAAADWLDSAACLLALNGASGTVVP